MIIRRAAERLPRDCALLVGIGAPSMRHAIELGETAMEAGSRALLLPMPMFFRYQQEDLAAFPATSPVRFARPACSTTCRISPTASIPTTVVRLLREEAFIVGIKDSSGQEREHRRRFRTRGTVAGWTLLVGDDRLLRRGAASRAGTAASPASPGSVRSCSSRYTRACWTAGTRNRRACRSYSTS